MTTDSPSRGERTRQEIVQAAYELFIQQGYHGTSMRQIARRAGVAPAGLYNHFPSKEAVFKSVFSAYHPVHQVLPLIIASQGETAEDFLRDAAGRLMVVLRQRPDLLNLMFIELVEFKSAHVGELFQDIYPLAQQAIASLVQRDEGRPGLSPGRSLRPLHPLQLMRLFIGFYLGYYLTSVAFERHLPPEFSQDAEQLFTETFLHGILSCPPGAAA